MIDLSVYESGDGGELTIKGNDLETTDSLYNQVYLAFFGAQLGDYDEDNLDEYGPLQERPQYWQNQLFFTQDEDFRMAGKLEWELQNSAITSQRLFELEETAKEDLHFLGETAEVTVEISAPEVDRVRIQVSLIRKEVQSETILIFMWDATKSEVIESIII